jgi:hypothetical protein
MIPNIKANNKSSYEAIRSKNKARFDSIYTKYYSKKDYNVLIELLSELVKNNSKTFENIITHKKKEEKINTIKTQKDKEYEKLEQELEKVNALNIERETQLMITKERNKNIEIYYTIYILFSFLLLIIEGSVILIK